MGEAQFEEYRLNPIGEADVAKKVRVLCEMKVRWEADRRALHEMFAPEKNDIYVGQLAETVGSAIGQLNDILKEKKP